MPGLEAQPALIKPNLAELSGVTGRPIQTAEDAAQAARALLDRGVGCVAVTLGADGALFCWPDCMLRAECPPVPVGSTVGAGDSVTAGFLAGLLDTGDYSQALRLGAACGSATAYSPALANRAMLEAVLPSVEVTAL